jgi:hypothetical protein
MYVATSTWDKVNHVRGWMKRKDIKKQPGYNWTEIANEVHIFVGCDASHPAMKQDLI